MLMLEQRIQQQFFESADLHNQAAGMLARPVVAAAEALLGCITGGGKLIACGSDVGAWLAPAMAAAFTGRFERDRPPLAAIALRDETAATPPAQQVGALGAPGDVLLVVDAGGGSAPLLQAAAAAHGKDMTVIALTGAQALPWREALGETDVLIAVPHERAARVAELHLLVLHCLCDAVDLQLMGEQEHA
jgi:D-sedoheptulose 7-phosphate isomerase